MALHHEEWQRCGNWVFVAKSCISSFPGQYYVETGPAQFERVRPGLIQVAVAVMLATGVAWADHPVPRAGTYSVAPRAGSPRGESVLAWVSRGSRHVTVDQRCPPLGSPGHKLRARISASNAFAVRGPGGNGTMRIKGRFVHRNGHGHLTALLVTIRNGCRAGTRHWHLDAV